MGDPQTSQPDEHSADAHEGELDALANGAGPPVELERPIPVADPVHNDGDRRRHDLGENGALVQHVGREHGDAKHVEDPDIHDQSDSADHGESEQLVQERFHRTSA